MTPSFYFLNVALITGMTMLKDCQQKLWDGRQIYNWVKAYVVFLRWQVQTDILNIYICLENILLDKRQ